MVLKRAYRYGASEIVDILRRLVALRAVEVERPVTEAGIAMLTRGDDFANGVVRHEADRAKCVRPGNSAHPVTNAPAARPLPDIRSGRSIRRFRVREIDR